MISVIMATYNGEKYIRQQLDSIINQTILADEIIICDDFSSDSTMDILKEYQLRYPNIRVSQNEINLGFTKNFWNLIHNAKGEYIVFSDQDDLWHENKLEIIKNILDNEKQILALNTALSFIDYKGNKINNYKLLKNKNNGKLRQIDFCEFVNSPRYLGMAMAIRRKLLDLVEVENIEMIHAHDWFLNQTAAYNKSMYFLDLVLTDYRLHDNNTYGSSANKENGKIIDSRLRVIEDEIRLSEILKKLYGKSAYRVFLLKHNEAMLKRRELFCKKKIVGLIFNYLKNRKYMSQRDILGDVYILMRYFISF